MKQYLKIYSTTLFLLLSFTFLSSLILTILDKNEILTSSTISIIANTISYIFIATISYILGVRIKKKGLINGILFSLIMILLTMLFGNKLSSIITLIKVVTKSVIIIFFVILGVNKKNS